MRIGIDLDNTIACYDGVFHQVAVRRGLIPSGVPVDKQAVRDFLRAAARNDDWTELQGIVYGDAMSEVKPFAGAIEFLVGARSRDWTIFVISHRSRYPYLGPRRDLHAAARTWLAASGITDAARIGLSEANVFLEVSLEDKLRRIAAQRCDVFIDDLPELLLHPDFPANVERICFNPAERCIEADLPCVASWNELTRRWLDGARA